MKSYRLIKLLPFVNGPELGYISKPKSYNDGNYADAHFWKGIIFKPELYPEYWEKVVENEYEILSFYKPTGNSEVVRVSKTDLALTVEEFFKNKCWKIHSAKRLSDGAIMTIGDDCVSKHWSMGKIDSFRIIDNRLYVQSNTPHPPCEYNCSIQNLIIEKKPLVTAENNYEILSIISTNISKTIMTYERYCRECAYYETKSDWLHNSLNCKNDTWEIHSVKRLSDGEIVTIGDKCATKIADYGIIKSFKRIGKFLYVISDQDSPYHKYTCRLENLIIEKKPLFITEDGVGIFEGDILFTVSKLTNTIYSNGSRAGRLTTKNPDYIYFADKEKAEEYVVMNEPCLSIKDVIGSTYMINSGSIENLTSVVKERSGLKNY